MSDLSFFVNCIRTSYAGHRRLEIPAGALVPAAVLIPIYEKNDIAHMLFAKRTLTVRHHKGQISFPGGARDADDRGLRETALRETEEEIGVKAGDVNIIAELDDLITPTNFRVTPYVGLIPHPYDFHINETETAELIEVPFSHLLVSANHRLGYRRFQDRIYEVHYYQYGPHTIWGVTGHILYGLLEKIRSVMPA